MWKRAVDGNVCAHVPNAITHSVHTASTLGECDRFVSLCPGCSLPTRRHGPISDCPLSTTEGFVREYIALAEGSPDRRLIEQRYGTNNVQRLVKRYQEEQATKQWIDNSTTSCPRCCVKVQKSMGCNHVRIYGTPCIPFFH